MSNLFTHEVRAQAAAGVPTLTSANSGLSAIHVEDLADTSLSAKGTFTTFTDANGTVSGAGWGRGDQTTVALQDVAANAPVRFLIPALDDVSGVDREFTFANTAGTAEAFGSALSGSVTTPLSSGSGTITLPDDYREERIALILQDRSCFVIDVPAGGGLGLTLQPSGFNALGDSERRLYLRGQI